MSTMVIVISCRFLSFQPLTDSDCYHEFCRLLVRLKSNYQLGELIRLDNYPVFIQLVAKFTISSLRVRELMFTVCFIYKPTILLFVSLYIHIYMYMCPFEWST